MYEPWSTISPAEEKHPMGSIVFSAIAHDCACVCAAYSMSIDAAIAVCDIVNIVAKEESNGVEKSVFV